LYFVDRSHELTNRYGPRIYRMRHLFIYTLTGFARMLKHYNSATGRMADATFAFAVKAPAQ